MPFLAPVVAWVGGVVSSVAAWAAASPILAGIAQTAFGIAAKFALNALFPPKTQSRASELGTQYGANIPRSVILGTCATEGHHIYRNSYGSGGRHIQDVFVLSSFRITAVPRVRYNGAWRILSQQDADGYWLVPNDGTSGDNHDNVRVKFYYGTMDQQAEPTLITYARPSGRWTAAHRGAGVAYAVVFSELNKSGDGLTSPAKLLFEVKGAPVYDWRKDSTVGGSGPQRWNDQNTWEYSDNPPVLAYNLERGFFNGGQRMVGKGVRASRLPLAEYTQAANICDEIMPDGSKRYRAHAIAKDGPGANHDANLTPILEAMCGSWVQRVDGDYPIAGAPQAIVATLTDADFKIGAPFRYSVKRKRTDLINTVASSYISPDDFYETKDAATRIDAGALAEDRETLASAIPFGAVTDPRQVDRLADIAIRGARYQASCDGTIHPKFLDIVKEGRWVRFNSKEFGDRTFQVLTRQLGGINTDGARDITISMQQISNGVFDPTAYETNPPTIIVVPPPQYLAEVQNFRVDPIVVVADGGGSLPGAQLRWDEIEDISVVGIDIEYWPANDPSQVFKKFVTWDVTVVTLTEGLTSLTDWFVRTRLRVDNGRAVAWSSAKPFTTMKAGDDSEVDYGRLDQAVRDMINYMNDDLRELKRQAEENATSGAKNALKNYANIQRLNRQLSSTYGTAKASWEEDILVATGPNSAIGQQLTKIDAELWDGTGASVLSLMRARVEGVEGDVNAVSDALTEVNASIDGTISSAAWRMTSAVGSGGNSVKISAMARLGIDGQWVEGGWFVNVTSAGAEFVVLSNMFAIASPTGNGTYTYPFAVINNEVVMQNVRLGNLRFNRLFSDNEKIEIRGDGNNAYIRMIT